MRRFGRIVRAVLIVLILAAVAALFTLTEATPRVADTGPPDAVEVGSGRDALRRIRDAGIPEGKPFSISLSDAELAGLTALANQALAPNRLATGHEGEGVTATVSRQLPLGRWLNVTAQTDGAAQGFPETRLTIGHVPLSPALSRRVIEWGRIYSRRRGVAVPPLDILIQHLAIQSDRITAKIQLPSREESLASLAMLTGQKAEPIDAALLARTYCRLAEAERSEPLPSLEGQVHRAFALPSQGVAQEQHNRALLVSLAMFAVDQSIGQLAGDAEADVRKCEIASPVLSLQGRDDLSKHWALSAGIAARMGPRLASELGVWKELADSLPQGTGFSFVDLATDRSGFRYAKAASRPNTAAVTARLLANKGVLLPPAMLKEPEGLNQTEFEAGYSDTESARYKAAVGTIDTALNEIGVPQ